MGVLVKPAEVNKVILALVRVYIAHGNRSDRKKARLKRSLSRALSGLLSLQRLK